LQVGARRLAQTVEVLEDPRIVVSDELRADWHEKVGSLARTLRSFLLTADTIAKLERHIESLSDQQRANILDLAVEIDEIAPLVSELRNRLGGLYREVSEWPAPFTADQLSQAAYFREWISRLEPRVRRVLAADLP
jgi:hypothetical protein